MGIVLISDESWVAFLFVLLKVLDVMVPLAPLSVLFLSVEVDAVVPDVMEIVLKPFDCDCI